MVSAGTLIKLFIFIFKRHQVQLHFKVRSRLEMSILKTGWWNFSYQLKKLQNYYFLVFFLIWSTHQKRISMFCTSCEPEIVLCTSSANQNKNNFTCTNCKHKTCNSKKNQLSNFGLIKETMEMSRILLVVWKRKKMWDKSIFSSKFPMHDNVYFPVL